MSLPSSTYDTATLVNPGSSLTDFTLMVDLSRMSAAWWSAVDTTDGTKGRAAKDSGPTELACDWIDFDSVNETGWLRVKWSGTLSDTGTQTLRIYPPQTANASVAASDTYGSDNAYDANVVVYLNSDGTDRTSNGNDYTAYGSPGTAAGKTIEAMDLDGTNDWYQADSIYGSGVSGATYAAWVYHDTITDDDFVFGGPGPIQFFRDDNGTNEQYNLTFGSTGGNVAYITGNGASPLQTWVHLVAVFDDGDALLYIDGSLDGSTSGSSGSTISGLTSNVNSVSYIGHQDNLPARKLNGRICEPMIATTARSAAWIEHEYEQTNDQATFWGTWTNVPVASTTTSSGAGTALPAIMYHRRMMGVS